MYSLVLMMAMTTSTETTSFFSLSPVTALILLGVTAGDADHDLMSLIDAAAYFESRKIPVNAAEMLSRANLDPRESAKTQVAQLLALRWLAEHPEMLRTVAEARGLLEAISQGKHAQDGQGFAKEYATRALARLDGKQPPPRRAIPIDSLRSEAFSWFPQRAGGDAILAGIDLRVSGSMHVPGGPFLNKLGLRDGDRDQLYQVAELVGNIRLDRVAVTYQKSIDKRGQFLMVRATGAFDHQRLAGLTKDAAVSARKEMKGPSGEPILMYRIPELFPLSAAHVGDTDIVVLFSDLADNARPFAEIEEALNVRAGKKDSVVKGCLADLLKKAPDQAVALAVGEISKETREQARKDAPKSVPPVPQRFIVQTIRDDMLRLKGGATMADADEARLFESCVKELIATGRDGLKRLPPDVKLPMKTVELLGKTMDSIQVESKGSGVSLGVTFSSEVIGAVRSFVEESLKR